MEVHGVEVGVFDQQDRLEATAKVAENTKQFNFGLWCSKDCDVPFGVNSIRLKKLKRKCLYLKPVY